MIWLFDMRISESASFRNIMNLILRFLSLLSSSLRTLQLPSAHLFIQNFILDFRKLHREFSFQIYLLFIDVTFLFRGCARDMIDRFRDDSQLRFCYSCESETTCDANMLTLRIVLLVLKNLLHFRYKNAIDRSLEAVLGPMVTDAFRKRFCIGTGAACGFGDPIYKAKVIPSPAVMPGLGLRVDFSFTFSFKDLHGEDFGEFLTRIEENSEDRTSD